MTCGDRESAGLEQRDGQVAQPDWQPDELAAVTKR